MTVRAEMAQVKSAALSGAGTVAVVAPPLKSLQTTSLADSAQIRPSKLSDYLCLTKPEVTFLVLIATALGGYMAVESPDILVLCHAVFGTALVAGGTAALNHYIEREHARCGARRSPAPFGSVECAGSRTFGIGISVMGIVYLAVLVNWLTSLGIGHFAQLPLYPHALKRRTTWGPSLGLPGAAPVLMGWAAMTGSSALGAWALYALLFVWQFPHFLAIA